MLGVALASLIIGLVIYEYGGDFLTRQQADTETSMAMLEKLRHSASLDAGLTVEQRLMKEVERSKRVGNLHSYSGWAITSRQKGRLVIAFSFREVDETEHRAEWVADTATGTFIPQTELAARIYGNKP